MYQFVVFEEREEGGHGGEQEGIDGLGLFQNCVLECCDHC